MSRKTGPNSQANLLRSQGVQALGSFVDPKRTFNPVGFYAPDREQYKAIWTNYDMNQCISRYIWKDLPNGLTSWNLERMLYFRGTLCGFKFAGRTYILPYTPTAMINPYGFPTEVQPLTYNGRAVAGKDDFFGHSFKLPVDLAGNETDEYSAILLYDAIPVSPSAKAPSRYFMNQIIIQEMADVFARVNINIVVSNKKILLQIKDAKQRDVVQQELESIFGSDCPFGIITAPMEAGSIQSSNDYNADDLFNTIKNYDAIRCFMSGISSKGFGAEKKERLVTGELTGAEEEKDLILDMGYDLRREFCEKFNKKFGTNISVIKRSDIYKEENENQPSTEFNGQGQTAEEEITIGGVKNEI